LGIARPRDGHIRAVSASVKSYRNQRQTAAGNVRKDGTGTAREGRVPLSRSDIERVEPAAPAATPRFFENIAGRRAVPVVTFHRSEVYFPCRRLGNPPESSGDRYGLDNFWSVPVVLSISGGRQKLFQ
jgi:hypothetical protein